MKQCPRCNQTYNDDQLNFCLNDGELLSTSVQARPTRFANDDPPTLISPNQRITNPYELPQAQPPARWQPPQVQQPQQYRPYSPMRFIRSSDQTLPTVALVLGILSLPMICCYGGIWLGIPAAVMGFIGMRNADTDTERFGGRGMAIGGMVMGIISFLSSLAFLLFVVLAG